MKRNVTYLIGIVILLLAATNGYGVDWCVQISTFRNIEGIRQDLGKVKGFPDARIEKIQDIYSLRVGYYRTEGEAKGELRAIKGQLPKAFVRKCANEPDRVIESTQPVKTRSNVKLRGRKAAVPKQAAAVSQPTGAPAQPTGSALPSSVAAKSAIPAAAAKKAAPPTPPGPLPFKQPPANTAPVSLPPAAAPSVIPSSAAPPPSPPLPLAVSPTDSSDPQQLFAEAEKKRNEGHYPQAIDLYKKVIQLSTPDGELTGRTSYRIALCHDIIGEKKLSESEYAQAIEKWPGLDIAPLPVLFAGGMKAYQDLKYESALKIFSLHLTAYPEDARRVDYMTACTLMQQGRYNGAMFLFDRVIERYPDSPEAVESIVAFGNMGLIVPKVRVTMFTRGYEWWRDPIHAYDTALKRQHDPVAAERILYTKGCALMIQGRYEEAHGTLMKCLRTYPLSLKIKLCKDAVGMNLPWLVKVYYGREDYAGVVGSYFQIARYDAPLPVDAATVIMIGKSLERMGLSEDASNFLKASRIKASGKDAEEIGRAIEELGKLSDTVKACDDILKEYRELQSAGQPVSPGLAVRAADCLFSAKQYGDCLPLYVWALGHPLTTDEKRWILLRTGQANLRAGKGNDAKKAFEELKATGADEFWLKMADFAYEDGKWTEKYNQNMKRK